MQTGRDDGIWAVISLLSLRSGLLGCLCMGTSGGAMGKEDGGSPAWARKFSGLDLAGVHWRVEGS